MSTRLFTCDGASGSPWISGSPLPTKEANLIFLDIKVMGSSGICYLIQFSTDPSKVFSIKVLKEKPEDICFFLDELVKKKLVIHDAKHVIFHLSKLYTISKLVKDFSFESIWQAEGIFRAETTYEQRLSKLHVFIPADLIDTMILARHRQPLAEELITEPEFKVYNLPESCLDSFQNYLRNPKSWENIIISQGYTKELADYYNIPARLKFNYSPKSEERNSSKLTITIYNSHILDLSSLANFFDYPDTDKTPDFDYLSNFPRQLELKQLLNKKEYRGIPTIPSKPLYEDLYKYCKQGYLNTNFLNSAINKIHQLKHVYSVLTVDKPLTEGEQVDFDLIPYLSAIQLYGIKIDKDILEKNRIELSNEINPLSIKLSQLGLSRPTATKEVLTWLRNIVNEINQGGNITKLVPNAREETIDDLIYSFPEEYRFGIYKSFKKLEGIQKQIPSNIDSIFPNFDVYGTNTHRMTAENPNPQAISKDKRARSHFCPPDGYLEVLGDFSNLEMRIMAYRFGVKSFIKLFEKNEDAHARMAAEMFKTDISKILGEDLTLDGTYDEILRIKSIKKDDRTESQSKVLFFRNEVAKTLNFKIPYGASTRTMAKSLRKSIREMEDYLESYYKINPELKKAIEAAHKNVERLHFTPQPTPTWILDTNKPLPPLTNPFGVRRGITLDWAMLRFLYSMTNPIFKDKYLSWLPAKDWKNLKSMLLNWLWQQQSHIQNISFNFGVQSTGAFFTKSLQRDICNAFIGKGKIVKAEESDVIPALNVHDELIFYIKDKETKTKVDIVKENCLDKIYKQTNIKVNLTFYIVKSWADKS